MKQIILSIVALTILAASAQAQACDSGAWSLTNQQPASCVPYMTNGMFSRSLPNAGSGGPTGFLAAKSEAIVLRVLTDSNTLSESDWGKSTISSPGQSDRLGVPIYYGRSSDPLYKVNCDSATYNQRCGVSPSPYAVNGTYWHIPNQARFAGLPNPGEGGVGFNDQFLLVWDQTNNKVLIMYQSVSDLAFGTLGNCSATTTAQADANANCHINSPYKTGFAQASDYTTSPDFQIPNPSGNSMNNAGMAMIVRHKEWMEGNIRHALYLNSPCPDGSVFPAGGVSNGIGTCSGYDSSGLRPPHGALFFLDYTDAQIDAMNLPAWQEPLIRAMAHYGGYFGDGSQNTSLHIARFESGQAYIHNGGSPSPVFAWLEGQGLTCGTGSASESPCRYAITLFDGLPNVVGPLCPASTCGVEKHLHIANECVAKGLAGLSGGCGVGAAPPMAAPPMPAPPTPPQNLRITGH